MILRAFVIILSLALLTGMTGAWAEMSSAHYRLPLSVLSGGGSPASSSSYLTNGTLGQSSPMMDPSDPPFSTGYDLYPGFWYTAASGGCPGDYYGDGDVDGLDLYYYILDYPSGISLETFADHFGRNDCPVMP